MSEVKNRKSSTNGDRSKNRQLQRKKVMRNRLIALIIICVAVVELIVLGVCKLTGIFDKMPENSTLAVGSDGKVVYQEVTSFGEDFYNKNELKSFVKDAIKEYNDKNGNKIKLDTVKVKGDVAYAKTTYASVKDYSKFTGIELSSGKMKQIKKNYDFDDAFVSVKDGKKGATAKAVDITSQSKLKVLVIKENVTVQVDGTICYVSDADTEMVDESTVTISQPDGNEDATQLTYIIYK